MITTQATKEGSKGYALDIRGLTGNQLVWIEKVLSVFRLQYHSRANPESDLFSKTITDSFGDALRVHHAFSNEPFSKDKFEYVLAQVLSQNGLEASLASRGNPGHDITINGVPCSLKTQANRGVKAGLIWISKYMELGKGQWSDNPEDLQTLLNLFFAHLEKYERIFTLRTLSRSPSWHYELVEIPKALFLKARSGSCQMMLQSRQMPKPGYCTVYDEQSGNKIYSLYFDGGTERKLQVKDLNKEFCTVHAEWLFESK